jgi:hypothetical protein
MPDGISKFVNLVVNFMRKKMEKEYIRYYLKLSKITILWLNDGTELIFCVKNEYTIPLAPFPIHYVKNFAINTHIFANSLTNL